ncbi:hypothetical protein VPHF86_0011 [Vibrio phage F86]
MEYTKYEILKYRSRRSHGINLPDYKGAIYIDLVSSPCGSDSNYFAVLNSEEQIAVEIAFGGYYNDTEGDADPIPRDDDFHLIGSQGHYEAQGRMFNSNLRVWLRGAGKITIIY